MLLFFFFFNDTAPPEFYPLSLPAALPIYPPRNDFRTLQARVFEPFFGRFGFLTDDLPNATWAPPVDVAEETDKILVRGEAPGVNESDLKINFEDGVLTVSGERQIEQKDDRNYPRI